MLFRGVRWQWKWRLGDNPQDNLTADVTTASQLVRLRCFRQRQNGGDYRLDRARVEEGSDLGQLRAVGLGQHPGSTHAPGRGCLWIDLCRRGDQDAAWLEDAPRALDDLTPRRGPVRHRRYGPPPRSESRCNRSPTPPQES